MLLLYYLIQTNSVQNKIIQNITNTYSKKLNSNFNIGEIETTIDGDINVKNVLVSDSNDTLFFVKNLKTNLNSFKSLVNGNIKLSKANIDGLILNIVNNEKYGQNNLEIFLDKIRKNKNPEKWDPFFFISSLIITNGQIKFPNEDNIIKINKFNANEFYGGSSFIEFNNVSSNLKFNNHQTIFKSKYLEYNKCSFKIDDFLITSNFGVFEGDFKINNEKKTLKKFIRSSSIYSEIKASNLRLNNFIESSRIDSLLVNSAHINISGTLDSLNLNNSKFDIGFGIVKSNLNLKNFFTKNQSEVSGTLSINNLIIDNAKKIFKINSDSIYMSNFDFKKIDNLNFNGIYSKKYWNIDGEINSALGFVNFNSSRKNIDKKISEKHQIQFNKININRINLTLPKSNLSGEIIIQKKDSVFEWKLIRGLNQRLKNNDVKFIGSGLGDLNKGSISFSTNEGNIISDNIIEYDFYNDKKRISTMINLKSLNLSRFNNYLVNLNPTLSGVFKAKYEGKSINSSSLILTVQDLEIKHDKGFLKSSDFYFNTLFDNNIRSVSFINSSWIKGKANGKFDLTKVNLLINNTLAEAFPLIPLNKIYNPQNINFDFTLSKDLVNFLNPEISSTDDFRFIGNIDSEDFNSVFEFNVPFFQYQDFYAEDLRLKIDNKSLNRLSNLEIDKLFYKDQYLGNFVLSNKPQNESLLISSSLNDYKEEELSFDLNFHIKKLSQNISEIDFLSSYIVYNSNQWNLVSSKPIKYNYVTESVLLDNFLLSSDNSKIKINGYYENNDFFDINLLFENVNFNQVLPINNKFLAKGSFDSNWIIKRTPNENILNGSIISNEIKINNKSIGVLNFEIQGNTRIQSYLLNLEVLKNNKKTLNSLGTIINNSNFPKVDIDLVFNDFDISFLSPLGKSISKIKGKIDGNINLWGELTNIQNSGELKLKESGFMIPFINVDYLIDKDSKINLYRDIFEILPTKLIDGHIGTSAKILGKFQHKNFRDWKMDLSIDSKRILMLNKPNSAEAIFYGKGLLSGEIKMNGSTKNPQLQLIGTTAPGTIIKIPWKDTKELEETSFITFIDKKTKVVNISKPKNQTINEIRGLEMFMELDINNDAIIEIVIDQSTGSYLNGRGEGRLLMETDTKGKFNMWGDFITYEGIYNFKNLGLLDKKFNLKPGGTIVWEGDPLGAKMDLNAIYDVPGGANPALLLDNPGFNKKIPTQVGIHLQGNLLKPDNPLFEIYFPNTSGSVVSDINYRLSDPQKSQLQAISLLSQGIFINDVSVSVQGLTNNLYEKASDLFSSILGDENEKLKVGLNYIQGDNNSELDIFSEDRLGLTLSTQVSDKILINGKIGVPVGGVNETLIVGDVQIDFILNEDGTLKAKVFNKENEFRYIGDELGYTQGMGISYNVDFNDFKQLINRIIKEAE